MRLWYHWQGGDSEFEAEEHGPGSDKRMQVHYARPAWQAAHDLKLLSACFEQN